MPITTFTRTSELTVDKLLIEVRLEIGQEKFIGRTHGKTSTYVAGCRGHLCRYRERTRRRQIRQVAARTELPQGVRPEVRPRDEQRWDPVFECIADCLCDKSIDDLTVGVDVMQQLGLDSMTRFMTLMESIKSVQVLVPPQRVLPIAQ